LSIEFECLQKNWNRYNTFLGFIFACIFWKYVFSFLWYGSAENPNFLWSCSMYNNFHSVLFPFNKIEKLENMYCGGPERSTNQASPSGHSFRISWICLKGPSFSYITLKYPFLASSDYIWTDILGRPELYLISLCLWIVSSLEQFPHLNVLCPKPKVTVHKVKFKKEYSRKYSNWNSFNLIHFCL
jgi:hypothetical protein